MAITNSLTKLAVVVDDITTVIATYDVIRLYRSINGVSGTYNEITASSAAEATLTGNKQEPFTVDGKDFDLKIDGTTESFTFGAVTTAADVASAITSNTSAVASDSGGYIQIDSPTTGTVSTLEVAAASEGTLAIGLYEGDNDHGEEAYETLVGGTKLYIIDDYQGDADWWYKTRYYHTSNLTLSDFSSAFQGREEGSLDPTYMIYGTGYLVDTDGTPMPNVKIYIYNKFIPKIVNNKVMVGTRYIYTTEADGFVSIPLIKGAEVQMSIENTHLTRDITVPDSGDTFDLMTTDLQDSIGIVTYDLVDATRTTL
jgi:hypothetical protein